MKTALLLVPFAMVASMFTAVSEPVPAQAPSLMPLPQKLEMRTGCFELDRRTVVVARAGAEREAEELARALRGATGYPLPVRHGQHDHAIELSLDRSLESVYGSEGYRLTTGPAGVTLRAASSAGLFYGGVTLRQLFPAEIFASLPLPANPPRTFWTAPAVTIEDRPRFAWRGLLLDVARHFEPLDVVKRYVDLMAVHKLNTLQLHLTDDQGWRIEIRKYPRLTQVGSVRRESPRPGNRDQGDGKVYGPFFYTQAQLRELVAYAEARHVTLVPEIEMPGHFLAALTAYPSNSCTGGPFAVRTRWGVEPDILCAGSDAAVAFAQDILREVMEVFPGTFIHIGGDEAPRDRWKECPRCQARMRKEGLKAEAELQTYLNHQIEKFLVSHGRRLIGWDEILEGGLTPGAAVTSWRGTEGGLAAARAGHDVVMSPTSHCYFDYAQAQTGDEPESIGGFVPLEKVYAFDPLPAGLEAARQGHILGAQGNLWTEYIRTSQALDYFTYPRACALAEITWSSADRPTFADFRGRLAEHVRRLEAMRVNYRRLIP